MASDGSHCFAAGPHRTHKNLPQNASSSMCVRLKYELLFCDIEYFSIEEMRLYCIMGRGRNGIIDQSERRTKPSRGQRERGKPLVYFFKPNREIKKYSYLNKPYEKHESTTACRFSFAKRRRLARKNIEWKCSWRLIKYSVCKFKFVYI